jgi:hypothetical protein
MKSFKITSRSKLYKLLNHESSRSRTVEVIASDGSRRLGKALNWPRTRYVAELISD